MVITRDNRLVIVGSCVMGSALGMLSVVCTGTETGMEGLMLGAITAGVLSGVLYGWAHNGLLGAAAGAIGGTALCGFEH